MDETPICIDMPGEYTLEERGKKTITMKSTGHVKDHITIMLAGLADWQKLSPFVILRGQKDAKSHPPRCICQDGTSVMGK